MVEEEKPSAGGDAIDSEIENAKPEVPVKRKRGRPRLSESGLTPKKPPRDPNAPKRGRGRPRIYPPGMRPSQVRSESTGRPRGRPRKFPLNKNGETEDSARSPAREPRSLPPKKAKIDPDMGIDGSPRSPLKVALKSVSAKLTKTDNGSGSDVEKKAAAAVVASASSAAAGEGASAGSGGRRGRPKKEKFQTFEPTAAGDDSKAKPKGKRGRPPKAAAASPMDTSEKSSE